MPPPVVRLHGQDRHVDEARAYPYSGPLREEDLVVFVRVGKGQHENANAQINKQNGT